MRYFKYETTSCKVSKTFLKVVYNYIKLGKFILHYTRLEASFVENNSILLEKIEDCRDTLISLSNTHGLTSEIVIQTSKKLDKLLNEYDSNFITY
nr:aspartyl-phosphate phosphatase Spo0E family protein [Virgibacillus litoralis]